ncbi:PREDICTED: immunoglobulin superfamily member 10-like [Branchiostoma belcheri]|uniref:Immunoglobulin superfamily member 10-like n=1 Tax=Branchiostoma belcheri TaxID=7741 RepID=A0A6P4ZMS4_BRABE|nr:PREDICTED: immunoglobulin superfamily member 10-like [Branchiostoma belcheri]
MTGKKPAAVLMFLLVILKVVGTAEADCSCTASSCDCRWQSLTSVPQDLPTTITSLGLDINRITTISQSDFSRYGSLQTLGLSNNRISIISYQAFYPLSNLIRLYLYANRLTILRSDMFTGLENLKDLHLYHNDISDIQAGTFRPTPQLKNLYLSSNKLTGLRSDMFTGNLELSYLHLHNNQMTTLPSMAYDLLSSISDVNIDNNPWQCDCRMVDFRQKMNGARPFENQINCSHPDHLSGLKLIDINPENLFTNCQEPTIVRFEKSTSEDNPLVEGETLRLVCEASGIPTPDITVILPSGLNATVESVGKVTVDLNGTITITNVTAADAGLYVCVATSPVGSKLATLYIEFFYKKPTIVSFKRSGNDLLAQGETLHLVCEASGIPTPDITVILPSGVNATVESVGRVTMDVNGNIVIRKISAADSGLYGCIVANPAGFAFANLSINVIYEEPTIVRFERGDKNILVGGELLCEASGIPTPKITVILPSGQNATSDSDVTLWVNGSTVVTVTTVDAGLYICTASNTVGSKFATLYVDVESKVTTVATATSSLAITGTSYKPETNNYHAHDPSFSLPVLLAAVCGSIAGTLIIGGIILAIWCKRINQSAPKGPDFSVVFNNTNTTTTVITNGQDLTTQAQPISLSSNVSNPQLVPRPASSQFEPYEDVQPPPRGAVQIQTARGLPLDARKPKTRKRPASSQSQAYEDVEPPPTGAVSSQTDRGQALRSPNRTDNEPPPVPPPRTASATGYGNIPEHAYQPLAVTRNQPDNGQDASHHYQSLIRT